MTAYGYIFGGLIFLIGVVFLAINPVYYLITAIITMGLGAVILAMAIRSNFLLVNEKEAQKDKSVDLKDKAETLCGLVISNGTVNLNEAAVLLEVDKKLVRNLLIGLIAKNKIDGTLTEDEFKSKSPPAKIEPNLDANFASWNQKEKDKSGKI